MKKIAILLTFVVCSICLFTVSISAETVASGVCGESLTWTMGVQSGGENLTWTLDSNGTLTISGKGAMKNFESGMLGISYAPWYHYKLDQGITSVIIEDGVTSIGDYAFKSCNITDIKIPDSVTKIGISAFYDCRKLKNIDIPQNVVSIGSEAFFFCDSLESVQIPDSVTSIGQSVFIYCDTLKKIEVSKENQAYLSADGVLYDKGQSSLICYPAGKTDLNSYTVPSTVKAIDVQAFRNCTALTKIILPMGIQNISERAFLGSGISEITIPDSVTFIGEAAFSYCDNLTEITIPGGIKEIGREAFLGCGKLTSVKIMEGITSVGGGMFKQSGISEIIIPKSVTNIADSAFYICNNLKTIKYAGSQNEWKNLQIGNNNYALENATLITDYIIEPTLPKNISVTLDGNNIEFDQPPVLEGGRTLVPLRAIFEALGATVEWTAETQTVTSTRDGVTIVLSIGKSEMYINEQLITLDVAPQLIGGRTLVPVRAVAEGFNCTVDWIADTRTVIINAGN